MSSPLAPAQRRRRVRRNWIKGLVGALRRHCPVCGGPPLPVAASWMHSYLRCRRCHLVFVAELPRHEDLVASYRRVHESGYQVAHKRDWAPWKQHKHHTLDALGLPRVVTSRERALDLGCGEGRLLQVLLERGWRAEGLELNAALAEEAGSLGLQVSVGAAEDFEPSCLYSLITLNHLLEHLRDPLAVLRRLHGWLAPGGLLLVETPLSPDFDNIDHLHCFSTAALCRALDRCRFAPLRWFDYVDDNYGHHNLACLAAG